VTGAAWAIRPASSEDSDAIGQVVTDAGVAAWGGFLGEDRVREALGKASHGADLLAEDDDGVLAVVAWDEATGEILLLHCHPRGWGGGSAGALLDRALGALRDAGLGRAWLHTEERNARALRFYERAGWTRDGSAREREWHGERLREPRYVKEL
jgi:RimJ/RimL family protein N-acetyltransferase